MHADNMKQVGMDNSTRIEKVAWTIDGSSTNPNLKFKSYLENNPTDDRKNIRIWEEIFAMADANQRFKKCNKTERKSMLWVGRKATEVPLGKGRGIIANWETGEHKFEASE